MSSKQNLWTDEELGASVELYAAMLRMQNDKVPFVKRRLIETASRSELSSRSTKSIEYRLMNISSILQKNGRTWLAGYKPKEHVGPGVIAAIEPHLQRLGLI